MDTHLHHLLVVYGYWLMAFGAIIEGETFLVAGGIAAAQGMFQIPGLILLAMVGSMFHDGALFYLGRYGGATFFKKRPSAKARIEGLLRRFEKYGVWMILILRFAYGLRTLIPIAIGMTSISSKQFWLFDIIGGLLWSTIFIVGGYLFGSLVTVALHRFHVFEGAAWKILVGLIVAIGIIGLLWTVYKKSRHHP